MVSSVAQARSQQLDFQRRQEEHAKKSEALKRKLQEKHDFKPKVFKPREVSTTPPRSQNQIQRTDTENKDLR